MCYLYSLRELMHSLFYSPFFFRITHLDRWEGKRNQTHTQPKKKQRLFQENPSNIHPNTMTIPSNETKRPNNFSRSIIESWTKYLDKGIRLSAAFKHYETRRSGFPCHWGQRQHLELWRFYAGGQPWLRSPWHEQSFRWSTSLKRFLRTTRTSS